MKTFVVGSVIVLAAMFAVLVGVSSSPKKPDNSCTAEVKDWNAGQLTTVTCIDPILGPQKHIAEFVPNPEDLIGMPAVPEQTK